MDTSILFIYVFVFLLLLTRVDEAVIFKKDKEGEQKLRMSKQNKKKMSTPIEAGAATAASVVTSRGKKRAQEESLESKRRKKQLLQTDMYDEEDDVACVLKLQIPLTLKKHMVDEWKIVTKAPFRMLPLPRPFTVANVVEEFLLLKKGKVDETLVGSALLFPQYLLQLSKLMRDHFDLCSFRGIMNFCRDSKFILTRYCWLVACSSSPCK
jgi:hypothetical protein